MTKLIYIGGYGRSGSTLLEYLLTSHPALVACGEVQRSVRRFEVKRERLCTCGQKLPACPVWGPFRRQWDELKGLQVEDLCVALLQCVSSDYEVMVNSSKTAWGSFSVPWRLSSKARKGFSSRPSRARSKRGLLVQYKNALASQEERASFASHRHCVARRVWMERSQSRLRDLPLASSR